MLTIIHKPVQATGYAHGRSNHPIVGIVIHIEDGTEAGTDAWFDDPKSHVASHYSIKDNGEVHQYVNEVDSAYHAGTVHNPTWPLIQPNGPFHGTNPNLITVGIEHEGKAGMGLTPDQFEASAELIAEVAMRHNIPLDKTHVIPHHMIRSDKTCPGSGVSVEDLIIRALHYASMGVNVQRAMPHLIPTP